MRRNVKIILGVALLVIVMALSFFLWDAMNAYVLETTILGTTLYTMNAGVFDTIVMVAIASTVLCAIGSIVMIVSGLRSKD